MDVKPKAARIEVCSACQLSCPACPTTTGQNRAVIGRGHLTLAHFRRFLALNPQIRHLELGNYGEVFLNRDLPGILHHARQSRVVVRIGAGVNLNNASEKALEALVSERVERMRCSIDGATNDVYQRYRVGGDLGTVLRNISKINGFKKAYGETRPELIFQFIVFPHNVHQIRQAQRLSRLLGMTFELKHSFSDEGLTDRQREEIRRYDSYADRKEYQQTRKLHYQRFMCYALWDSPQVNWDGKLLGCSRNI